MLLRSSSNRITAAPACRDRGARSVGRQAERVANVVTPPSPKPRRRIKNGSLYRHRSHRSGIRLNRATRVCLFRAAAEGENMSTTVTAAEIIERDRRFVADALEIRVLPVRARSGRGRSISSMSTANAISISARGGCWPGLATATPASRRDRSPARENDVRWAALGRQSTRRRPGRRVGQSFPATLRKRSGTV